MIGLDGPVKHVDYRQLEEERPLSRDISILDVHLPQLIWPRNGIATRQSPGMTSLDLPLRAEDAQLFAEPVYLFLVDDQPVLFAQLCR